MIESIFTLTGTLVGIVATLTWQIISGKIERRDRFRMVSIEKRLDKAQEAYALWRELLSSDAAARYDIVSKCQKWWYDNCLFLSDEARQAFYEAYIDAGMFDNESSLDQATLKDIRLRRLSVGPILMESVGLPPVNEPAKREKSLT